MSPGRKLACAVFLVLLVSALGGCTNIVEKSGAPCPSSYKGFKQNEATSADVKACLGEPFHEDHNKDGRYVYVYFATDNSSYTYLFDRAGKLMEVRAYSKKR